MGAPHKSMWTLLSEDGVDSGALLYRGEVPIRVPIACVKCGTFHVTEVPAHEFEPDRPPVLHEGDVLRFELGFTLE